MGGLLLSQYDSQDWAEERFNYDIYNQPRLLTDTTAMTGSPNILDLSKTEVEKEEEELW